MKRMNYRNAKKLLDAYCLREDNKPASTNKVPSKEKNAKGTSEAWWLQHLGTCPSCNSSRTRAYLKAYIHIGKEIFFSTGIPLADGFMLPDRGVMKSLLLAGAVRIDQDRHGLFVLTESGRNLISDMPAIDQT
jgi:hypothetical protein